MSAQPESAQWASDGTQVVDPPGGTKATGFLAKTRPPAQYMNWILSVLTRWVAYLAGASRGTLRWTGRLHCDGGASHSTPGVYVDAIDLAVLDAGSLVAIPAYQLAITDLEGYTPGALLANSEIYYAYLGYNAGAPAYQISTTAPATVAPGDTPTWKAGVPGVWRYLGTFTTDSAGTPIPFRASRGRYVFQWSGTPAALGVLLTGHATTSTAVPLAAILPPHVRMASLHGRVASSAGVQGTAFLGTYGDNVVSYGLPFFSGSTGAVASFAVPDIALYGNTGQLAYCVDVANTALTLTLTGFAE